MNEPHGGDVPVPGPRRQAAPQRAGRSSELVVRDAGEGPVPAELGGKALQGAGIGAGGGGRPGLGEERVDRGAEVRPAPVIAVTAPLRPRLPAIGTFVG